MALKKEVVRNTYQTIAEEYDNRIPGTTENDEIFGKTELDFILNNIMPSDRVLDMGSGTGRFTIPMAEKAHSVTALDLSSEMLAVARKKAQQKGLAIEFYEGDMTNLPFSDNSFDIVTSMLAMMHIPVEERINVFKEAERVLAPGGRFLFSVKNKLFEQMAPVDRFASIDITDIEKEELIFTKTKNNQDLIAPWYSFSPRDIKSLAALTGLNIVEISGNTPIAAWLLDEILKDETVSHVVHSLENILGKIPPLNHLGYYHLVETVKPLSNK